MKKLDLLYKDKFLNISNCKMKGMKPFIKRTLSFQGSLVKMKNLEILGSILLIERDKSKWPWIKLLGMQTTKQLIKLPKSDCS
jgi:hypothetical protein